MKRLLLFAVLAVALLGLLGSPALAGKAGAIVRPPTNVPILFATAYDDVTGYGIWWVNTGATDNPWNDVSGYDASDVVDPANYEQPIPPNTDVYAVCGWVGAIYGQVKNITKYLNTTLDITETTGGTWSQHFTNAQAAPYWTGPHQWDLWWAEWYGDPESGPAPVPLTFNPKISAGVYLNHLYLPIGPFPNVGWYHLAFTQVQTRPINDLILYDPTWVHPAHAKPGANAPGNFECDFNFYVGP
jgi:hypothetical protein